MKFNKYFKIIMESVKTNSLPTIDVLYDFVKDKRVYNIPIKKVIHELQPTPWEQGEERPGTKEFIARADKADLTYPIIVFKSKSNKLHIMDGVHRVYKARKAGNKYIKGHILTHEQAVKFKWKDHNGVGVSFESYNNATA